MATMKRLPRGLAALLCLLGMMAASAPAYAHKIMVFGYLEGGRVELEGYFADGKKAENSLVEVFGPDGRKLLEGRTDEQGRFSFPMPDVPEVRIVLSASMGHRAECVVEGEKTAPPPKTVPDRHVKSRSVGGLADGAAEGAKPAPEKRGGPAPELLRDQAPPAGAPALDEERLRTIIDQELERKLAPLRRELTMLAQPETSLKDIIGGIGYIVGLMGLLMYYKARRKSGN